MTAIVAIHDREENEIWMGADSLGTGGNIHVKRTDPKIFRLGPNEEFLISFTSSFRMGDILKYSFTPPRLPEDPEQLTRYMNTDFIDAVRSIFSSKGYMRKSSEEERGGAFLVAVKYKDIRCLYHIETDFQVGIDADGYSADGAGYQVCLGSLHSTEKFNIPTEERIKLALEAASEYCTSVGPPLNIMSL